MPNAQDLMRLRFAELRAQKAAIDAQSAPLRAERDAITAGLHALEAKAAPITAQIKAMAPRIKVRAVELQNMPFNNKTQITDVERAELARWISDGALVQ